MKKKMCPMTIYEVHTALFDVLNEVDRIFKNNGIEYFLIFGTLLGAIRDGGPIKWDDDIDICVKEGCWDRMNDLLTEQLNYNKFFLLNHNVKKSYPCWGFITRVGVKGTYRRMDYYKNEDDASGIFIDIFQLVNVPSEFFLKKKWEYQLGVVDGIINSISMVKGTYPKPYFLSRILMLINNNREIEYWNKQRDKIQRKFKSQDLENVTVPFGPFGVYPLKKCCYKKEYFDGVEEKRFVVKNKEGEIVREAKFPVPWGYNGILKETYGDWGKKPRCRNILKLSFWS